MNDGKSSIKQADKGIVIWASIKRDVLGFYWIKKITKKLLFVPRNVIWLHYNFLTGGKCLHALSSAIFQTNTFLQQIFIFFIHRQITLIKYVVSIPKHNFKE